MMTEESAMPALPKFPMARGCPMSPPTEYAGMREAGPAMPVELWDGTTGWLVTRFKDVRALLADSRFSAMTSRSDFPKLSPTKDALYAKEPLTFFRMDAPDHAPHRAMVTHEFALKAVNEFRPSIQAIVDTLVDAMIEKGPPADFIKDFANPLPSIIIARMLGVPNEDQAFFQERTSARLDLNKDPATALAAIDEMLAYLGQLVSRREAAPGDATDILSRLVIQQVRTGKLTHDDAVAVADLLLRGGHETTSTQMTAGLVTLFRHSEQWTLLQSDPSLVRSAIEEMLRFNSIVQFAAARVCTQDAEVGGHQFHRGDGVYALLSAANRDPSIFPEPDKFDIARRPNPHVAFGFGPHVCVGQILARAEMEIAFTTLIARLPGLRMATPFEEIQFKPDFFITGPDRLSVAW